MIQTHGTVIVRAIEQTKVANREWQARNEPFVRAQTAATAAKLGTARRVTRGTGAHLVPSSLPKVSANHHIIALIIDGRLMLIDDPMSMTNPVVLAVMLVVEKAQQSQGAIQLEEPIDDSSYVALVRDRAWNPATVPSAAPGPAPVTTITLHEEGEAPRPITPVGPIQWML